MSRVAPQYNQPLSRAASVIRHSGMWSTAARAANDMRQTDKGQDGITAPTPYTQTQQSSGFTLFSSSPIDLVFKQVDALVKQFGKLGNNNRALLKLLEKLFDLKFNNVGEFKQFLSKCMQNGTYNSVVADKMSTLVASMNNHPNDPRAVMAEMHTYINKLNTDKQRRHDEDHEHDHSKRPGMKR
ncbi:MAG: hypothetical protein P1U40_12545 [Coxiellaceae bacterium]|nr:hypothetical protein [Coxiellaceae bacterium]